MRGCHPHHTEARVMRILAVVPVAAALAAWCGLATAEGDTPPAPRFPALSNEEAWKQLPREEPPLPAWARTLVRPLPRTTAAMLELDHLHRADTPLGAAPAGKLRWAAADVLGCEYGRRCAE